MRAFTCPDCSSLVPFESTRCLVSDSELGYSRADREMQGPARRPDRGRARPLHELRDRRLQLAHHAGAAALRLLRAHIPYRTPNEAVAAAPA